MELNEALKLCIDGKRVTLECNENSFYVYWNSQKFIFHNLLTNEFEEEVAYGIFEEKNGWKIYNPKVDFISAWKDFLAGKTIRSCTGDTYNLKDSTSDYMEIDEMMGEWEVL